MQYNFIGSPARFFFMKANMFLLPVRVLHVYTEHQATFVVRLLSLFNMVDLAGEQLSKTETVTVLNDMCVFAPASLIDPRPKWTELDPLRSQVTFANGPYTVSAILYFNQGGELVNFVSDDRSALQDDGSLRNAKWSTPVRDYRAFSGRKVPGYGETIWNYPEGDFTYGTFTTEDIQYNVKDFIAK